ncbi:MAG: hypothetical protein CML05_09080 [Pseudozobellia sp.]|nr:hypothetical protein [Pseudozobellia sp.]|tara:strand:+ start:777470 stop:778018 length:549 start_codon:yes stop_codon:yes gene_type:complete
MNHQKVDLPYVVMAMAAVLSTWLLHEFAHWLTSVSLGYQSAMFLNGTSFEGVSSPTEVHRILVSAAGPLITIIQGFCFYFILSSKGWNKYLYLFLFSAFYMRALAGFMNLINANDEGRISEFFNLATFTIPVIVSLLLFFLVYKIGKMFNLGRKFHLATTFLIMLFSSILIMANQMYAIRIL